MERRGPSPMRLAVRAIGGAVLAASVWMFLYIPIPRLPAPGWGFWDVVWEDRLRFAVFLCPLILGTWISYRAEKQMKRGFADKVWTDAEITPVRAMLAHGLWGWAVAVVVILAVVSAGFALHGFHFNGLIFVLAMPFQTASRLRQLLTPKVERRGGLLDWKNFQPLHSDHWGEPAQHDDTRVLPS